jgi:hypothetical protein
MKSILIGIRIVLILGCNLFSLFKEANRVSVRYDFTDNKEHREKLFISNSNPEIRQIASVLCNDGFTYNSQNDTIVLFLQYSDRFLFPYPSLWGRKYYAAPDIIECYSSMSESHLMMKEDFKYYTIHYGQACDPIKGKDSTIPELIKKGDHKTLSQIYEKYAIGDEEYHIRIIIKAGAVISAIKWNFLLGFNYWEDIYSEQLPQEINTNS